MKFFNFLALIGLLILASQPLSAQNRSRGLGAPGNLATRPSSTSSPIQSRVENLACEKKSETSVINIAFSYPENPGMYLDGVVQDRTTLDRLTNNFSNHRQNVDDAFVKSMNKQSFLAYLRRITIGKNNVMLNYSGHGVKNSDGQFEMIMPNMPRDCVKDTGVRSYRGIVVQKIQRCSDYIITASDLTTALEGKTVFGIIDSCHSGAIQNSPGLNHLVSATGDQAASDSPRGGLLFTALNQAITEQPCSSDTNLDGKVDLAELYENVPPIYFPVSYNNPSNPSVGRLRGLGSVDGPAPKRGPQDNVIGSEVFKTPNHLQQTNAIGSPEILDCFSYVSDNYGACIDRLKGSAYRVTGDGVHVRSSRGNADPICQAKKDELVHGSHCDSSGQYCRVSLANVDGCKGKTWGWVAARYLQYQAPANPPPARRTRSTIGID